MEITSQQVSVKTGSESMPCHLARPISAGPHPGLVVVMEAFGLNDHIKKIADRFAAEGFVAIAPNLYFRQPNNVVGYNELPGALKLMGTVNGDQLVADMTAPIEFLKTQPNVKSKFGTVGFCMGGMVSFLTACRNRDVAATAPFYGGGMVNSRHPGIKSPIEYVNGLHAHVLAFFGGKDAFIPIEEVDKFRDALKAADKPGEIVFYPDADHGFMCDERPSFHPQHAKEAFAKTVAFFRQHLG